MAWTSPMTFTGAVLTAAQMNTHVRDNFLELETAKVTTPGDRPYASGANALSRVPLGGVVGTVENPLTICKDQDSRLISDTSLHDDEELQFPVGANETWVLESVIYISGPAVADFYGGWYGPRNVTGTVVANAGVLDTNPRRVLLQYTELTSTRIPNGGLSTEFAGVTAMVVLESHVYVVNGSYAGNIVFIWKQAVSDPGTTTVHKGSYIRGYKVA